MSQSIHYSDGVVKVGLDDEAIGQFMLYHINYLNTLSNFTVVATISLTKGEGRHEFDDAIKAITIYQAGELSSTANIQVISGDNIALRCKLEAHGTWFLDNDVRQEWEFRDNDAGRETISRNGKKVIENKRVRKNKPVVLKISFKTVMF